MSHDDFCILRVLADNSGKAPLLQRWLKPGTSIALEVGSGPFGLGVIGYVHEIPFRIAMDPLPPTPMDGSDPLRQYVDIRRKAVAYIVGCGEEIPVRSESMDLVICCNVIDHASKPDRILDEIRRVLRTGGQFFFDVHTFSVLGLAKWHTWTRFRHKEEMLVKAHPYRMFEATVRRKISDHGFEVRKLTGHSVLSACAGHARTSTFLGEKRKG
jgi:SAM-dependent methyltransferase